MTSYSIYVLFSACVALFLAVQTDRKLLSFVLILWILAQPVINSKFVIPLPGLPFELQPNRLLLLFSLLYVIWGKLLDNAKTKGLTPPFDKYIIIYFFLVIISVVANSDVIQAKKEIFAAPLEIITFYLVYTLTKSHVTEKVFQALIKAIIFLAVISSIIAFIQFTADTNFFRVGDLRPAFGDKLRSTGIFQSEYDQGYFQILATIVILIHYQSKWLKTILVLMISTSVVLTFHRMDMIILYACLVSYYTFFSGKKLSILAIILSILLPIMVLVSYDIYQSTGNQSAAVEERLKQDTVTGRFQQYELVWETMSDYPLGMGSYTNQTYMDLMLKYGMTEWRPDERGVHKPYPLGVHNGYLATGILYGFMAMTVFMLLVVSMLRYFKKTISPSLKYSLVGFYMLVIYVLANLSNSISIFRAYYVLLMAIICGSLIALSRREADLQLKDAKTLDHTDQNIIGIRQPFNNIK